MKPMYVWGSFLGLALSVVGCGSDDDGKNGGGGSCLSADRCFHVTKPAGYDLALECQFSGGTVKPEPCNPAGYKRKCTDTAMVSTNDGPEEEVTYVYFYPANSTEACFGTEEQL